MNIYIEKILLGGMMKCADDMVTTLRNLGRNNMEEKTKKALIEKIKNAILLPIPKVGDKSPYQPIQFMRPSYADNQEQMQHAWNVVGERIMNIFLHIQLSDAALIAAKPDNLFIKTGGNYSEVSIEKKTAICKLSDDDYEEIKKVLCPYCVANLPDYLSCMMGGKGKFIHTIPGTNSRFDCEAQKFRNGRYDPNEEKNVSQPAPKTEGDL